MDDIKFRSQPSSAKRSVPPPKIRQPNTLATTSATPVKPPQKKLSQPAQAQVSIDEPFIPLDRLKQDKKSKKKRQKPAGKRWLTGKKTVFIGTALIVVGIIGFGAYYFLQSQNAALAAAKDFNNNTPELAQALRDHVAKYLEDVPEEAPDLETIDDPSAAGNGAGFKDAQHGDKVLYFKSAGKAIIYRPSTGKVLVYTYFTQNSANSGGSDDSQTEQSSTSDTQGQEQPSTSDTAVPVTSSGSSPLLP